MDRRKFIKSVAAGAASTVVPISVIAKPVAWVNDAYYDNVKFVLNKRWILTRGKYIDILYE